MSRAQFLNDYKLVVTGSDSSVELSALVLRFIYGGILDEFDPTTEDCYRKKCVIDGEHAVLNILDTAGHELYGMGVSELFIRDGDGILLVYSITSRISFEKIHTFHERVLEVKDQDWFPIILVGDDCHLEHERQVGTNEGRDLAKHFACPFIETSSKHGINVDNAFYSIVREIRKYKKNQPKTPSGLVDIQASLMPPMPRPQARWRRLLRHLLPFSNTK